MTGLRQGGVSARPIRTTTSHRARVGIALAIVFMVWGSTPLAISVTVEAIPPFTMSAIRFALAGAMLYAWSIRRGDRDGDRVTRTQLVQSVITGGVLLVGGTGLVTLAQARISSGLAALLCATIPLWLAMFSRGVFGERLSPRAWVGLCVGLFGTGLLVDPGGGELGSVLLALGGAMAWAAGSLRSRVVAAPRRPLVAASLEMLGGALIFAVVAVVRGEPAAFVMADVALEAWSGLAYLVVAGSVVAFSAYRWLLANASTVLVGTYAYVNPVIAMGLGWVVLGEVVSIRTLIAGAVVLVAVFLLVTGRPGEPVPGQATSGGDVFAGSRRWRRVRHGLHRLPHVGRLHHDLRSSGGAASSVPDTAPSDAVVAGAGSRSPGCSRCYTA